MPEINMEQSKEKIQKIQGIVSKLDHVITLYLHPQVYKNGDYDIELSDEQKLGLTNEYSQIKAELESEIGTLPE